jgi:transcriptional regulator with XRE-family HTH domain
MYLPETINERIVDLRTSRGLKQKELAELVGISPSQISRIETGKSKNITADTIARLAKALNISADYILGLTTITAPKSCEISE